MRISPIGDVASSTSLPSYLDFFSTFDDYPADQGPRRTATIKARFAGGVWGNETLIFEVGSGGASDDSGNELIERMRIAGNGDVGIGTPNPQHLLQVAGTIGAEEVIVSATGADYVFQPDYRLAPLDEVGAYIKQNHHLPDVPSAAEMQTKGVSLGEMQTKLLAKIEELTLHMIQVEQENHALKERVNRLEVAGDDSNSRRK